MKRKSYSERKRRAELQFHESQGRLLEHAYAKGFYEGAMSQGAVFIPYVGLVCAGQKKGVLDLLSEFLPKSDSSVNFPPGSRPEPTAGN